MRPSVLGFPGKNSILLFLLAQTDNPMQGDVTVRLKAQLYIFLISLNLIIVLTAVGCGSDTGISGTNSVDLTWNTPTTNVDLTCLTDLDGYKVSYGASSGNYPYSESIQVNSMSCADTGNTTSCGNIQECTYVVSNITSDTRYFVVQAYDVSGNLSPYSNEVFK